MDKNQEKKNNGLSTMQKTIIVILALGLIGFVLLLFSGIRNYCIYVAEKLYMGRSLNKPDKWHSFLKAASFAGIFLCFLFITTVIFYRRLLLSVKEYLSKVPNKQIFGTAFKDIFIEQPFLLIFFVFILYIIKNVFFAVQITGFDVYVIILALLIHFLVSFFIYRHKSKNPIIYLLACYSILIFSLIVSSLIYDYSYDGLAYHQTAAIKINEGWNPFYTNLSEEGVFVWNNHYPKFTEIFASIFLSAFGNIELGKSYNIIFFVIVFFYACKYTSKLQKNKLVVLLISIVFTANPVVLAQLFSFCVDGVMGMMIIILIFACMDYEQMRDNKDLLIIIAVSIFSINTKFTGFICGFVLIGYVIKLLAAKKCKQMAILILVGFSVLLIGVVFTGYNPYITNTRDFGHPFYPLYGKETIDIISPEITELKTFEGFDSMHPVKRFFSLFFLQYNLKTLPFNPMKMANLAISPNFDLRIGGFGILFVEFCVFLAIILFFTVKKRKTANYKKLFFPICLLLFISILMPENWWARYIPFFWYLFGFLMMASDYSEKINKKLFLVCLIIVCINCGYFIFFNTVMCLKYEIDFKRFIKEINRSKNDTIHIVIDEDCFSYSIAEKLRYYNIKKNIIFIYDDDTLFPNDVVTYYLRGWY